MIGEKIMQNICAALAAALLLTVLTACGGKPAEAESWLECVQITPAGAVFFGAAGLEKLTDKEIKEEIIQEAGEE